MPFLCRRRTLHFTAKNTPDKRMRLRLRLLCEPPLERHSARRLFPSRAGGAYDCVLSAKLYRRTVSQLRRGRVARRRIGNNDRDASPPARGISLFRLYPRKGDSRRRRRARPPSRAACRPFERQYRAAFRRKPPTARAGQNEDRRFRPHVFDSRRHRRKPPRPRPVSSCAALRSRRTKHADDRRRDK